MVLWKLSWNELRARPGRMTLTLLSVVIGVASVVSVELATQTVRRSYDQMFRTISGRADLEIVSTIGRSFDENVVATAAETPGIQLAVPLIRRFTILYHGGRRVRLTALGIDPQKDAAVRDYELLEGRQLDDGTGIWLDAGLAERLEIRLGEEVRLLTRIGLKTSEVVGMVRPRGGSAVAEGGLVFMSLRRAQSRFRAPRQVDTVSVLLDETADETAVQEALVEHLPAGLSVRRPVTRSDVADETLLAAEQAMRLATAFSLLLAVFIITNTFGMSVGERRRQFAMLRAIGATQRQISLVLYREALVLGITGTLLGVLVGMGGAAVLARAVEQLLQTTLPRIEITMVPIAAATVLGLVISLIGTYLPARRAARLTPLEGMRPVAQHDMENLPAWLMWLGAGLFVAGSGVLAAVVGGWAPVVVSVSAAVAALVGVVTMIPLVLDPVTRLLHFMAPGRWRVEFRLARQQLLKHRGRTALTIGVLFVAMSTGVGLANALVDNVNDVKNWYRQAIVGDFFVRAMMPDMATGESADIPDEVRAGIEAIDGITSVDSLRLVNAEAEDLSVVILVREFTVDRQIYFDLKDGDPARVVEQLRSGDVVIGTVLAQRTGTGVGDTITLQTLDGPKDLRIAGLANDYIGGGLTIAMHRDTAHRLLGVAGDDVYIINADPRSLREVERKLAELCDEHGLLLQSYADLVAVIHRMMAGVVGSLWGLLALGFAVAAFGVVNTLTMNVLEQTRELGILRAVAMTRGQVRTSVFAQALSIGLIGLLPGSIAGLALAYLMNLATLPVTGHIVDFQFHPRLLAATLAGALAIVLAAALLPGERAARLSPLEALRYE